MRVDEPSVAGAEQAAGALFTFAPEALLVLRGDRVERANARAIATAGVDPTNRPIRDLIPDWRDPPDGEVPFDAVLHRQDGDDLPVEVRARTLPDGAAIVSFRDARAARGTRGRGRAERGGAPVPQPRRADPRGRVRRRRGADLLREPADRRHPRRLA